MLGLVLYAFSELGHSLSKEKFLSFNTEVFDEEEYKYNILLCFIYDIITNRVKYQYHPQYNLKYSIENFKTPHEYVP